MTLHTVFRAGILSMHMHRRERLAKKRIPYPASALLVAHLTTHHPPRNSSHSGVGSPPGKGRRSRRPRRSHPSPPVPARVGRPSHLEARRSGAPPAQRNCSCMPVVEIVNLSTTAVPLRPSGVYARLSGTTGSLSAHCFRACAAPSFTPRSCSRSLGRSALDPFRSTPQAADR